MADTRATLIHESTESSLIQRAHLSALATWLDKGPVRNGGSAAHWLLFIAGSIPIAYRMPGLCHLSPLQQRWRDGRASGLPVPAHDQARTETLPDQRLSVDPWRLWPSDPDPPPDWEWERVLEACTCRLCVLTELVLGARFFRHQEPSFLYSSFLSQISQDSYVFTTL